MVTILELKKAKMVALKNKDKDAQNVFGLLISAYQKAESDKRAKNQEMSDADMVSILNKVLKELTDEKAMYEGAGRVEDAKSSQAQMDIVKGYLPQLMSEAEIRGVIDALADKSIKSIMMTFKGEYAGKADMSLVSRIAKDYQGK